MSSSISTEPSLLSIRPICCSSASLLPHGGTSRRTGRPAASARASAWCARSIWCARRRRDGRLHRTDGDRPGLSGFRRSVPAARPRAASWCRTGSIAPSGRCWIATTSTFPISPTTCEWRGDDRWRLTFPHARSDCAALSGNCKCSFAEGRPRELQHPGRRRPVRLLPGGARRPGAGQGFAAQALPQHRPAAHCVRGFRRSHARCWPVGSKSAGRLPPTGRRAPSRRSNR